MYQRERRFNTGETAYLRWLGASLGPVAARTLAPRPRDGRSRMQYPEPVCSPQTGPGLFERCGLSARNFMDETARVLVS